MKRLLARLILALVALGFLVAMRMATGSWLTVIALIAAVGLLGAALFWAMDNFDD